MSQLQVIIVTPEREVLRTQADYFSFPTTMGELGIFPDHTPLVASLQPGIITVQKGAHNDYYAVSNGYAEVSYEHTLIMAEACEQPSEIDLERAQRSLALGEELLFKEPDNAEAHRMRIMRALTRIAVKKLLQH